MTLNITHIILLNLLLLGSASAQQPVQVSQSPHTLKNFKSVYNLKKGLITIGETTRSLSINHDGSNIFESITKPAGAARFLVSGEVIERSEWRYKDGLTIPLSYSYHDTRHKDERNVELSFDWEQKRVTNTINGDPWKMSLPTDTQDKLLYQIRLMLDLPLTQGDLHYAVADGGVLKEYTLQRLGEESIKIRLGEFEAIKVRRISGERVTTFWCAKELAYLPVRIEQRKGSKSPIVATLVSVQGLP